MVLAHPGGLPTCQGEHFTNGWLPSLYQGTLVRPGEPRILNLDPAPLLRGLEADDDSDGLPNWFEMYWFGKFMDWKTATVADPKAIGAGGKTLLEHYQNQTDPTPAKETTNNAN
jgi:hypothetical protein